jgi:hypothetical protein
MTRLEYILAWVLIVVGVSGPLRLLFADTSVARLSAFSQVAPFPRVFLTPDRPLTPAQVTCEGLDGSLHTARVFRHTLQQLDMPYHLVPRYWKSFSAKFGERLPHLIRQEFCASRPGPMARALGCRAPLRSVQFEFHFPDSRPMKKVSVSCSQ